MYTLLRSLVGNTPLFPLHIGGLLKHQCIYVKLEYMNPTGSIKDRIVTHMIDSLHSTPNTLLDVSSGNTGISLACFGRLFGSNVDIILPQSCSYQRIQLIRSLGARTLCYPSTVGFAEMCKIAQDNCDRDPKCHFINQFEHPMTWKAHYDTTANEICCAVNIQSIDAYAAGIGTGGSLYGIAKKFLEKNSRIHICGILPTGCSLTTFTPHILGGIGDGIVGKWFSKDILSSIQHVSDDDAIAMSKILAREYGLMCGLTSGANVFVARDLLMKHPTWNSVLTLLPDRSDRYFCTPLFKFTKSI
jgi:cysteine synthase A